MSLSVAVSPPHIIGATSAPLYSPPFPRISVFLYPPSTPPAPYPPRPSSKNRIASSSSSSSSDAFALLHHAPTTATMTRGPRGFLSASSSPSFSCCSFRAHSPAHFESADDDDEDESPSPDAGADEDEEEDADGEFGSPDRWDVLGLGQAMVDFSGTVDDQFLEKLGLEKGTRKLVNHEERGRVLRAMDGCSYKAAAGGSLSNTLVALARLGSGSIGASTLNVAMAGSVGSDPLGDFYRSGFFQP